MKKIIIFTSVFIFILILYSIGVSFAAIHFKLEIRQNNARLLIDGNTIPLPFDAASTTQLFLEKPDPLAHEFQIDGSDSITNHNYEAAYFQSLSNSFYYKLSDWMRGGSAYNKWQDLRVFNAETHKEIYYAQSPATDSPITLPEISKFTDIQISLFYPVKEISLQFITNNKTSYKVSLNRNDRTLKVFASIPDREDQNIYQTYFPRDPGPFLGENLISLARILLVSFLLCLGCLLAAYIGRPIVSHVFNTNHLGKYTNRLLRKSSQLFTVFVIILLMASLIYTLFISVYEFQSMPHILDELAYYSQAKIFALGQLSLPATPEYIWLRSPFMVMHDNHWFMIFPPGTSLILALGMLIHMPWIVTPVLGVASLFGIYLLAKEWFGRPTGILALGLVAFSPFYSFQAASYLSHTVCLFFLVFMSYFWQVFCRKAKSGEILYRYIILSAACLGFAFLTRELAAIVIGGICAVGIFLIHFFPVIKKSTHSNASLVISKKKLIRIVGIYTIIFFFFVFLYLLYNHLQTGNMFLTPKVLHSSSDIYGFGKNIGHFGEHTVAAGLVSLDQLMTSIQFELFGWPYAFTLGFIAIPFLLQKANRFDYLCLIIAIMTFVTQIPFYYHGIAIGPRHLFEVLPFLVFLTARGIIVLNNWVISTVKLKQIKLAWPVILLVAIFLLYNLVYYTPRHLQLYYHFLELPNYSKLDTTPVYNNKLQNAIVLTQDWNLFYHILAAMNDPKGQSNVLFAYAPSQVAIAQMRSAYPTRKFYWLNVSSEGKVTYIVQ